MSDLICNLRETPRLMDFPFRLALVGWTSRHRLTKHVILQETFVCLSFNRKKYDASLVDYNSLSFLPSGIHVEPTKQLHDEVFFSYHPRVKDDLSRLFRTSERCSFRGFVMNDEIKGILQAIRAKLDVPSLPGTADSLDVLAIQLIASILTSYKLNNEREQKLNMDIYELAAELRRGKTLEELIRKYNFSRRTFYNEWRKIFSISPIQYRLNASLTEAADLLQQTDLPIKEISHACGFNDLVYFYQRFRKCYGVSPAVFRKRKESEGTGDYLIP